MELLKEVEKTVDWATELGDRWAGTTVGRILDSERENLLSIVKADELELASVAVVNLMQTCMYAEQQLEES